MLPLIFIACLLLAGTAYIFNRLVRHRNRVGEAWSGIDVQLKRRHDLVPNIVLTVKAYAQHEREVLEEVTRARSRSAAAGRMGERVPLENLLSKSLLGLMALVEDYPELKADRRFLDLQEDLVAVENDLQMARRYYNGTVRDFNTMVESFPSNIVARVFGFEPADFFEIELATQRTAPEISLGPEEY